MNSLLLYGILYSISLMILIVFILLIKKILARPLTVKAQYYLWFALFEAAGAPFLPKDIALFRKVERAPLLEANDTAAAETVSQATSAIQDLAVDSGGAVSAAISLAILVFWLLGAALMLSRLLFHGYQAWRLCRDAEAISDPATTQLFAQCRKQLGIRRHVHLKHAPLGHGPIAFGIFRSCILVPYPCNKKEAKFILLHELSHCKHRDALSKLFMQLLLSLNWFNPAVWFAASRMENDREVFCDQTVLDLLDTREQNEYGHAIINWSAWERFSPALGLGGNKKQLRLRVMRIASYQKATLCRKRISCAVLAGLILLTLALIPPADTLSAQAYDPQSRMNLEKEDLSRYFGARHGSFVLYNQKKDSYTVYNEDAARTRISPNSTYKIYSGLLALESGAIAAGQSTVGWDGKNNPHKTWNQDQDLHSAMENSVNWYFQELDKRAGMKKLQSFYSRIGYGNCDLTGGISEYWKESSLKISPLEQVMLLNNVYQNKWGFSQETITAMEGALRISDKHGSVLSGKTGTGMVKGREVNGCFVGFVEQGSNVYVFAANVQGSDGASGRTAMKIAEKILEEMGIY